MPDANGEWHLIDASCSRSIGHVVRYAHCVWYWKRSTVPLLHGALPAEGHCRTLGLAKSMLVKGLPNN